MVGVMKDNSDVCSSISSGGFGSCSCGIDEGVIVVVIVVVVVVVIIVVVGK